MRETPVCTAADAIYKLAAGNLKYLNAENGSGDISRRIRMSTWAKGQSPYAVIVTCSDSRVIPENIFSGVVMLVVSFMTSTLTTRIKKQEQLRMESETEKMRANLLRAVSHDLRTPLTSIYGSCSTVIDNYDSLGREQKIKLLSEACADAQWLNRMVENLLSVTRIDADGVAIQKTPTVLEELVDTVLVRFQKLHPGVPVEVKLPDDFIVIPMDSMLIQQVLTNLLENAVLHAKGMTCLTLRVFTLGQRAVFEVIDNGCGIPEEYQQSIFQPFFRVDKSRSREYGGAGLGLSLVWEIADIHGGSVRVEESSKNGTVIAAEFPIQYGSE